MNDQCVNCSMGNHLMRTGMSPYVAKSFSQFNYRKETEMTNEQTSVSLWMINCTYLTVFALIFLLFNPKIIYVPQ